MMQKMERPDKRAVALGAIALASLSITATGCTVYRSLDDKTHEYLGNEFHFINADTAVVSPRESVSEYVRAYESGYLKSVDIYLMEPFMKGEAVNARISLKPSDIKSMQYAELDGKEVLRVQTTSGQDLMFPTTELEVNLADWATSYQLKHAQHVYRIGIKAQSCFMLVPDDVAQKIDRAVESGAVNLDSFMSWEDANAFLKDISNGTFEIIPGENVVLEGTAVDVSTDEELGVSGEDLEAGL